MEVLVTFLFLLAFSGVTTDFINPEDQRFGPIAVPSCRDCFDRRIAPGAMYWDGCHYCQCDRQVPLQSRCKTMSCQWSPCPRVKQAVVAETADIPPSKWSQWDSLSIGRR